MPLVGNSATILPASSLTSAERGNRTEMEGSQGGPVSHVPAYGWIVGSLFDAFVPVSEAERSRRAGQHRI